jgi:hypothetical protein
MEEANARRYGLWGAVILGWWTLNGSATASQYYFIRSSAGEPITWSHALGTGLTSAYLWVPLTVLALWLTWRYPIERERLLSRLLLHLPVALAVPVFRALAVRELNPWVGWYVELPPFPTILLSNFVNNFFFYWMLLGVAHALHFAQRSRQREQLAERLRTELVQAQLHNAEAMRTPGPAPAPSPAAAHRPGWFRRAGAAVWSFCVTTVVVGLFMGAWALALTGLESSDPALILGGIAGSIALTPLAVHRVMGRRGSYRLALLGSIAASVASLFLVGPNGEAQLLLATMFGLQLVTALVIVRLTRRAEPRPAPGPQHTPIRA